MPDNTQPALPIDNLSVPVQIASPAPAWHSLSPQDRQLLTDYLANDTYGRRIRAAARNDDDFAVWLTATCAEFHRLCGHRPVDPHTRHFRRRYHEGRTPIVAAKLDLHLRPMALIADGDLQCPLCDATGNVCHEDIALRRVALHLEDDTIYADTTPTGLRNGTFHCTSCDTTLQLPRQVQSNAVRGKAAHTAGRRQTSAEPGLLATER